MIIQILLYYSQNTNEKKWLNAIETKIILIKINFNVLLH